ncbi:hypothetical protein Tsp_13187, partial [Trichinella spiralis]|uniref:hypothetical protein n=1 Tax=Trichinella spiralis TaxID=6334 RepID=UPI0001EFD42E
MCSAKTPALKSGRRRGKEVNYEGQIVRVERRRGSRSSTSATDLGTRMVTRGRKKLMEASVREAGHHGGESASTVDVDVVESKKITGKTARRNRRAPSGDGKRRESCGAECGQAVCGNAVADRSEASSPRTPNVSKSGRDKCGQPTIKASTPSPPKRKPTTSSSPRTPCLSKRGARSKIPSTPDTPSTSGGSGKQRVLVSPLLRTEKLPDLEVLQRTEEQVTVRATFPIAQAVVCPLGCEKPYTAVRPDGQFAHQTLTRHFMRVHNCHSVQWHYRCRNCNTDFLPADHRYPLRVVNTHVRSCVSRWEITRKLGESEDLHGVRCDLCDYVGVSKRAVGLHRRRHANENIMQNTGTAAQIEALSKQVGEIRVAGDYSQFKFGKRVRQYVAPTQRRDGLDEEEVHEAEEEEVPAESRTILGEPSTATAIGAEEISATGPVRADTAAQQMICRIGQWCVWPQDYHSIPAPQCWTDTLMDLMIEQIVLQRYPDGAGVSVMSCSA